MRRNIFIFISIENFIAFKIFCIYLIFWDTNDTSLMVILREILEVKIFCKREGFIGQLLEW